MRTISIRELHNQTGHFVREAGESPFFVTERGRKVAMLVPLSDLSATALSFPLRTIKQLIPLSNAARDSTQLISEDRDRS